MIIVSQLDQAHKINLYIHKMTRRNVFSESKGMDREESETHIWSITCAICHKCWSSDHNLCHMSCVDWKETNIYGHIHKCKIVREEGEGQEIRRRARNQVTDRERAHIAPSMDHPYKNHLCSLSSVTFALLYITHCLEKDLPWSYIIF